MTKSDKWLTILISALILGTIIAALVGYDRIAFGAAEALRDDNRNIVGYECNVYAESVVSVGHQESKTVLAASSSRAWAIVQLPINGSGIATNTASLSLDGGAATLPLGIELSTTTPYITFGIKTDLPFTGAVTALTSSGTSTLRVVECGYL